MTKIDLTKKISVKYLIRELEAAMAEVFDNTVYPRVHALIELLKNPEPELKKEPEKEC